MIDVKLLPNLKKKATRTLYFEFLNEEDRAALEKKNFCPVITFEMPRESEGDHQNYLMALLQGMTDGTIEYSKGRLESAELEMKARQMLGKDFRMIESGEVKNNVEELWNWGQSRYTIQGNSTIVDPRAVDQASKMKEKVDDNSIRKIPRKRGS